MCFGNVRIIFIYMLSIFSMFSLFIFVAIEIKLMTNVIFDSEANE